MFDAQPEAFGSFRVVEEIGSGRLGRVYRAHDPAESRDVAVKVFDPRLSPDQLRVLTAALERLKDTPLDHAAIASPLAAGSDGERAYLVEPLLRGTSLGEALRRDGPQPVPDAVLRITQLAGAVDFAAAVGVHHGTLHPNDILVADDATFLTGLGVAQALVQAGIELPVELPYASPQRKLGLTITRADDIYALATIAFEMLYARPLGEAEHLADVVTPLDGMDPHILRRVLETSLSLDPTERPTTALDFAAALQRAVVDVERLPGSRRSRGGRDAAGEAAPAPRPVPEIDIPLRPQPAAPVPVAIERPPFAATLAAAAPSKSGGRWIGVAAALALGLLTGFASGFVIGQRERLPLPASTLGVIAPRHDAPPATIPPPPEASPPVGQDYTESTVPPPPQPVVEQPVVPAPPQREEPQRVARVEPAVRSEPPAAAGGRVLVRSTPSGARVIVDGLPKGATPLALRGLAFGTHDVEVTYLGYETRHQRVTLTPHRPAQSIDFSLRASTEIIGSAVGGTEDDTPGVLQVDSRPAGAQVFLDNAPVGVTPLLLARIPPGSHSVRIQMPGYAPWATLVNVAAGTRARVAASLDRALDR